MIYSEGTRFHNLHYISLADLFKISGISSGRAPKDSRMFAPFLSLSSFE